MLFHLYFITTKTYQKYKTVSAKTNLTLYNKWELLFKISIINYIFAIMFVLLYYFKIFGL